MLDLIIIGAGPAGLAASTYAAERRLDFLLLSRDLGGKCNYRMILPGAEDYPDVREKDLVSLYKSKLERLPHSYRLETATALRMENDVFSVVTDRGVTDQSRVVLVAAGARTRRLNVPGEFQYLSRGVGYSATACAHLFKGKRVFLAGDSDRVLNSAIEMAAQSGSAVVLLLKDSRCSRDLLDYVLLLDRVQVITDGEVTEFRGGEYATEVVVSWPDRKRSFSADGFFVETELQGNTSFLQGLIELNDAEYIPVDAEGMTRVPGLFAAGDVTGCHGETVLAALGQGAMAMHSACRYLLHHKPTE